MTRTVHGKRRRVRVKTQRCVARTVKGTVTFKTAVADVTVSRGAVVYATGSSVNTGTGSHALLLTAQRALRPGLYTLTTRVRHGRRTVLRRTTIRIAAD